MTVFDYFITLTSDLLNGPLGHIVTAIVILILGLILGLLAGSLAQKLLHQLEADKILSKIHIHFSVERFLGRLISYVIYFMAFIAVLSQFQIASFVLNIMFYALAAFVVFSLLLAVKDIVPNVVCGLLLFRRPEFKPGTVIEIQGIKGVVETLDILYIVIEIRKGEKMIIPNVMLFKEKKRVSELKNKKNN